MLASVFARQGNARTGQGFVDGLVPAIWVGAAVLAAGALLALAVPGRRPQRVEAEVGEPAGEAHGLPVLVPEISAS